LFAAEQRINAMRISAKLVAASSLLDITALRRKDNAAVTISSAALITLS
jgi:hypothetical protein